MHRSHALLAALTSAYLASAALAQPGLAGVPIDTINHWSWQENCGWTNWRGAGDGTQEAVGYNAWSGGFIWCENIGWVNLGDGTPTNGVSYSNTANDHGVNYVGGPNRELGGFAWGENVGWINFGPFPSLPANQRARVDNAYENQEPFVRWLGFAWGENIGWINLDDATRFPQFNRCDTIDFNNNGVFPEDQDVIDFFSVLAGQTCPQCNDIDYNNNGVFPEDQDVITFFSVLAGGACV